MYTEAREGRKRARRGGGVGVEAREKRKRAKGSAQRGVGQEGEAESGRKKGRGERGVGGRKKGRTIGEHSVHWCF